MLGGLLDNGEECVFVVVLCQVQLCLEQLVIILGFESEEDFCDMESVGNVVFKIIFYLSQEEGF